ncbi:MAG TPA: hypothetical protein VF756_02395 [Thermoanaerobaculia bacterium]
MEHRAERFVVDEAGNRVGVLLDIAEYQTMLEQLEELKSIRAYDLAKASGETAIPFEKAIQEIEREGERSPGGSSTGSRPTSSGRGTTPSCGSRIDLHSG